MQPCEVCLDLDRLAERDGISWKIGMRGDLSTEYALEFEYSQLELSAKSGCRFCWIVWNGLELMGLEFVMSNPIRTRRGYFILQKDCPLEVELIDDGSLEFERICCTRFQYYTREGRALISKSNGSALTVRAGNQDPHQAAFGAAKDISPDLQAEQCSLVVRDWINNCQNNHPDCTVTKPNVGDLPSRLLDIEPQEDGSVRLVDSRDNDVCHGYHYATLSHCWGKVSVIQTTTRTLPQRKKGIEWKSLPKTFQDAVIIVRSLGIRFVWIDSLCIVQDDNDDWRRESARMATIYSNSYLNLAATAAADSRGGCLSQRRMHHASGDFGIASLPVTENDREPTIFVRPSFDQIHRRYSMRRNQRSDLPDSRVVPLLSRAWVFQERQLARRTIHFHPSEMIMECKTSLVCECTGLNNPSDRPQRNLLNFKSLNDIEISNAWVEVVEEFSRLLLTQESDRLPALIGVATVFQARLQSAYLAGLWEKDIARGLLWDVIRQVSMLPPDRIHRQRRLFVPSWSWASLVLNTEGAGIIFPACHDESFEVDYRFEYLKTDIPESATESNSNEQNRTLWLQGAVATAIVCPTRYQEKDVTAIFEQDLEDAVLLTACGMNVDVSWCTDERDDPSVYCLLVGTMIEDDWELDDQIIYQCTLVMGSSAIAEDVYARIGVLDIRADVGIFQRTPPRVLQLI